MNVRILFFLCSASNIIVIWSILQTFPSLVNCVCAQSLLKIMRSCRKIISSFYFVEICVMMNSLFYSLSLRCRYITILGCLQRSTSTERYLSHFFLSLLYGFYFLFGSHETASNKWWLYFELHTKWSINGLSCILFTYCSSRFSFSITELAQAS